MSKKIIALLLLLGFVHLVQAQKAPKEVSSKIEKVIVFTNGGQIIRKAQSNIFAGQTEVVFRGISPYVDKQSIQLKAEGKVTVLSVVHQANYLLEQKSREEIEVLEKQKKDLVDKIEVQRSYLSVYIQEEKILNQNQKISGNNTGLSVEELQKAMSYQRAKLTEVKLKQIELKKTIASLEQDLRKIEKQMKALNTKKNKSTSEILVKLSAKQSTNVKFTLSYLVQNAGWYPTYDLRVKDIKNPIKLAYKANVYQNSGEDWKNIKLTLSNGSPQQSGIKPELQPWFLDYSNRYSVIDRKVPEYSKVYKLVKGRVTDETGTGIPGTSVFVKGITIGTVTDANGEYQFSVPLNAVLVFQSIGYAKREIITRETQNFADVILKENLLGLDAIVVVNKREKNKKRDYAKDKIRQEQEKIAIPVTENLNQTSISFDIDIPYTIPSDGKNYTVEIKEHELNSNYQYFVAPKLDTDVFLTAQVVGWEDYNLLEGQTNLFFEGTYLGKSVLDTRSLTDTLDISLGRDKSVVVTRNKVKDFSKKRLIGANRVETKAWEIQVKNNKKQVIKLSIEDQIPVSKLKEITVELLEKGGAKYDEKTGKLTWNLTLQPSESKKLEFRYEVKYPKNKPLSLE